MSAEAARAALAGEGSALVTGLTWVPFDAIRELLGDSASTPAESLVAVAAALRLDFIFVPADQPWAGEAAELLHQADVAVMWAVPGVFGRVAFKVGWSQALRMSAGDPGALAGPLAEALHAALCEVRAGFSAGADAIVVADDLAGSTGPLLSPDFILDVLVPCYHHVALLGADAFVPCIFHSDGDVRAFMPAPARGGFAGVHLAGLTADALVASHAAARSEGLVVLGGIDAMSLLHGPRHLGAQAARLALAGGMLVCDDGGITSAQEIAALSSALDAARDVYGAPHAS